MIRPNLKNAVRALRRVVRAARKGERVLVDDAEVERRLAICRRPCPHLIDDQCRLCTCFVDAKALLATETCPIGKWEVEIDKPAPAPQ